MFFSTGGASATQAVVKTASSSVTILSPEISTVTPPSTSPEQPVSPSAFHSLTTSAPTSVASSLTSAPSSLSASPEEAQNIIPPSPSVKAPPPLVTPKPQSLVNVVSPMTQTVTTVVTPPTTPTKPASVPTYVPTRTVHVAPSPISFCPQVLQTSSLSPIGEGASTPTRGTPSGHATTALRQGVPQKPYTFLDEKSR